MIALFPGERLEPLGGGLQLVVSPAHEFSVDSLLLAAFAAIRKTDKACDLGTGCGIIPLLWCKGRAAESPPSISRKAPARSLKEVSR